MNILIEDTQLHYEEYGNGIPVICLHGFYVDSNLMKGCLEPVFSHKTGYKRIYLDLVGMGKTPANESVDSSDKMLHIVTQFITEVVGEQNFILFGESYGGYLALALIEHFQNKISGLFLLCPCTKGNKETRNLPLKQILMHEPVCISEEHKKDYLSFLDMAVIANNYTWGRYTEDVLTGVARACNTYLQKLSLSGYTLSCEKNFASIQFGNPTTVLLGKQDHIVGYKDALQLEPNFSRGTFAIIDSAGHNLQIEKPELFSSFVEDFLGLVALSL